MRMKTLLSVLFLLAPLLGLAQSEPVTPRVGSPERAALMNALREAVVPEVKQKVVFQIEELRILGDWAFLCGMPQNPDGSLPSYRGTKYEEAIREGMFDHTVCALFRKRGGQWTVVEFVLGATDVPWVAWPETHRVPPALFEPASGQ